MLDVTNLPSLVNNSEKRLRLGLVFLINIGKIIVPGIPLSIKDKEMLVLRFSENLRTIYNFYNNLNASRITDKRKLWQTIQPNCSDKLFKFSKLRE